MYKIFIPSFLMALCLLGTNAQAQQQNQSATISGNHTDNSIIAGHFEIAQPNKVKGITEYINVNFGISPLPITNVLHLELNTPQPTLFTARINTPEGNTLQTWKPREKSYLYNESIDISKLTTGSYVLCIYDGENKVLLHTIPFTKGK